MALHPHDSFDVLASVIEQLGADGRSVRRAEAAASEGDHALCATVEVAVPLSELVSAERGVSLEPVSGDDGGDADAEGPAFSLRIPGLRPDATAVGARTDVTAVGGRLDSESVIATLEVVIEPSPEGRADAGRADALDRDGETPDREEDASDRDADRGAEAEASDDASNVAEEFGSGGQPTSADEAGDDAEGVAAVRDESVPAYEDTAYLRRLYETCDTFAEMSERIEMDVSSETVRRYMIDAGVHSPTSYELDGGGTGRPNTADGSDAETAETADAKTADTAAGEASEADPSADGKDATAGEAAGRSDGDAPVDRVAPASLPDEQLVADGIGLPEELTLSDVVEAVVDARTVYEVQCELGLGHDRTRQLLRQLNVLDLVLCRVQRAGAREVTVETVAGRIRQCAPDSA